MGNPEPLNLAYLRAFRLVAQTGSATRAASALYRAQSAVTRSLQELETAVGETLFERRSSGMLPTPAGRVVIERCERIFAELEELAQWCAARQSRSRSVAEGTARLPAEYTAAAAVFGARTTPPHAECRANARDQPAGGKQRDPHP